MAKYVSFLVDGFNLYHSLREIERLAKVPVKWLDLRALCESYLQAVRNGIGERVEIAGIHYFSALAHHLSRMDPGIVERHRDYVAALENRGVSVALSQFKLKDIPCPHCRRTFTRAEEKETDVALGVKLIEVLARNECDTAVLVTGDTDLIPAIRAARRLFPHRKIGVGFPFLRHNAALKLASDYHFRIGQKDVERSRLPNHIQLADGRTLTKPASW